MTNPGHQTGTVGTPVRLQIHATDSAAGQTLTYKATGLPAGLSIKSSTGLISGTPTTAVNAASVTVTATDTTSAHGSATFTWTINNAAANVVTVTSPGNQTGTIGTPVSLQIHATDSAAGQTLTYTATGLPAGLSINSTGLISGTPTTAVNAAVTVTATDTTSAHGSAGFTWTISTPPPLLCATVAPYLSSTVAPGGTASFAIFVWTANGHSAATKVTVSVARAANVDAPAFGVCPSPSGALCSLVSLPIGQATEMVAGAAVTSAAANGTKVTLTATAQATGATTVQAHSTITVTKTASTSPSSPSSTSSLLPGLPSSALPGLPGFSLPGGTLPDGAFTTPTNPAGLFPTVTPGDSHGRSRTGHGATTDSAILPLDSRLIGWQLAGLAVLATAIAIAVARLSLRSRPHDGNSAPPQQ